VCVNKITNKIENQIFKNHGDLSRLESAGVSPLYYRNNCHEGSVDWLWSSDFDRQYDLSCLTMSSGYFYITDHWIFLPISEAHYKAGHLSSLLDTIQDNVLQLTEFISIDVRYCLINSSFSTLIF